MVECINCVFWKETNNTQERGRCHRYAPRPFVEDEDPQAVWPRTDANDCCGEGKWHHENEDEDK